MYAFQAAASGGVEAVWVDEYPVDSKLKPGGLSNGSGSTLSLVGHRFVAITDTAPGQVNLNVYQQVGDRTLGQVKGESTLVCRVPLFQTNASANENAMVGYFDGSTYSVVVNNHFAAPHLQSLDQVQDINGEFNDFGALAPGITRIDITEDGECATRWESQVRSTSVLGLSTANGLLYSYTQDDQLASQGEYVWILLLSTSPPGR